MKQETMPKEEQSKADRGYPIQMILLLGALCLSLLALILKFTGII